GIVDDIARGVAPGVIAWRFHVTLIALFAGVARRLRAERGINAVALGGGVFLNEIFLTGLTETLHGAGFEVFWPQEVPPGDGGMSLGQIAMARAKKMMNDE
ncbi:MAG TPA: carbamoyltransferase HypF, partial [Planctomycetota bacterium]|nr:carbamoyltransferase HypF [Planctomycetota bacterium]